MSRPTTIRKPISFSSECKKCHGTGWILYESDDGSEYYYGEKTMIEYARRCDCGNNFFNSEDRTEFPTIYRDCGMNKFDFDVYSVDTADLKTVAYAFFNKFEKWQEDGKGLYLWSRTPGSGKTWLSACLAKGVMMRTQRTVKYITPIAYMDKVSQGYNDKSLPDPSQIYRDCALLVLDDLGTQLRSDWHMQELFRLIDDRSANNRTTIITSNYKPEDLNVDDRLKSRILKSSIVLHMPEESVRNKKASEEQGQFIERILTSR